MAYASTEMTRVLDFDEVPTSSSPGKPIIDALCLSG